MDAVKFVREYLRMCAKIDECEHCPVCKTDFCAVPAKERSQESAEEIVELVKAWSKEHPRRTRQSIFLEQWPETELDRHGVLQLCPSIVSAGHRRVPSLCTADRCANCRREFWMQEVDDTER